MQLLEVCTWYFRSVFVYNTREESVAKYSKVCAKETVRGVPPDKMYDKLSMCRIYLLCTCSDIIHRVWPRMKEAKKKKVCVAMLLKKGCGMRVGCAIYSFDIWSSAILVLELE